MQKSGAYFPALVLRYVGTHILHLPVDNIIYPWQWVRYPSNRWLYWAMRSSARVYA